MMTYSINIGTSTQATTYNIIGATSVDLSSVLTALHDNTNKEISPEVLRNSVLTSFAASAFNQTTASQSSIQYIGIDNGNLNYTNKDIKNKIYFGKRAYSGTYSYSLSHDIMSSSILNRLDDVFIFNTKKDTSVNSRTRISILAGSASNLFSSSPYIQSQVITTGTYSSLSLDLINQTTTGGTSNVINFKSIYGTVSLNNIMFPTINNSNLNAGDNKALTWNNGSLSWNQLTFPQTNYIGATGSPFNITGTPVNINGYSLDFTSSTPCPIEIGDIKLGETFNSVSISEMLRRIVYPYLPPLCGLSIRPPYNIGYIEIGTSPNIIIDYTITKRTLPTNTTTLSYMIPSSYVPITSAGQSIVSGSASGVIITPVTSATTSFTITVTDGVQSNSDSKFVKGIYPYFYGFSNVNPINLVGLSTLNKLVEKKSDKSVDITGSGNLYFIYDSDYPVLSNIYDELGNTVSNYFTSSLVTLSSPTGLWASKQFRVYQRNGMSQIGPPSVTYQFKY